MENKSLVRQSMVEEAAGVLEVSGGPRMTGGYADIYHGFWTNPQGTRVEVAVKELRALIPRNQQTKEDELLKKAEMPLVPPRQPNGLLTGESQSLPIGKATTRAFLEFLSFFTVDFMRYSQIYQAAYGLEHLHSRTPPISHADVKPENVLINDLGEAALSDFGLSRVLHGLDIPSGFTTSETVKGTLNYKAPELFLGEQPTCSSDVYAFGGLVLTVSLR
ncbi:hypothetical protein FS837_001910 [Tulasnella sp. UAMH 9824]|nr:hypothetical protein FS837_001910 [Tulasnella sp. UAMH 9824]